MKVEKAFFTQDETIFKVRRSSYAADSREWAGVVVTASDRGLMFQRERTVAGEVVTERECVPYGNIRRWSPPAERRPLEEKKPAKPEREDGRSK